MLIDRTDYPRPLFYRENWINLNGIWDFALDDEGTGLENGWNNGFLTDRTICVPFSYETERSGIGDPVPHTAVWYQKRIDTHAVGTSETILLHFEGSDYRTDVYADGRHILRHEGGYERFSCDLGELLPRESVLLVVRVEDSLSKEQPRGKQRYQPQSWGCWYVQTTGIWKTVWMERVNRDHLRELTVLPDPENGKVVIQAETNGSGARYELSFSVYQDGKEAALPVQTGKGQQHTAFQTSILIPSIRRWKPEDPFLYELKAELKVNGEVTDTVWSYFGFRSIRWKRDGIYLNDQKTYLRFVLDQGYWPESGLTPPDAEALRKELDAVVRYGYNGVRMHQKIEDGRLLYLCDERGILVFSEMAAAYAYTEKAGKAFLRQWQNAVIQHMQHPCIIAWVPFNESWGIGNVADSREEQSFTESVCNWTRETDPTRPVISNDGWEHTVSDIVTIHDYREEGKELVENHGDEDAAVIEGKKSYSWYGQKLFANGYSYQDQPLMLSEYGGIAFRNQEGWGYGTRAETEEAFLKRFLSQNDAIRSMKQFSGFCYTQLTDVEQEKNGLLTADRKDKLSEKGIRIVHESNRNFS